MNPPSVELQSWQLGELSITEQPKIGDDLIDFFYGLYAEAFTPLAAQAAARHLLHREEFSEEMRDRRIWKYVARSRDGRSVGLATLTKDPDAVPWISPQFYQARYPEQAARRAIYYQGYSLVVPGPDNLRVYHRLSEVTTYRPRAENGVIGYDLCDYNIDRFRLDRRIESIARRQGATAVELVDRQSYYTLRFD